MTYGMSSPFGWRHITVEEEGWSPREQSIFGSPGGYQPPPASGAHDWTGQPGYGHGQYPSQSAHSQSWVSQPQHWPPDPPPPAEPVMGPPPAPPGLPDEPTLEERTWVDLRHRVASRLRSINATHCHEAFDRFDRRNALGPHGIVLFYTALDSTQPFGYQMYIATRLFLAGPESDDLAGILTDLARTATGNIARANARDQRWDPRGPEGSMVNGGDAGIPREATFVGTGVTTLDTEEGSWYTVANSVRNQPLNAPRSRSVFDLAGQCIALLTDGTALRAVRNPNRRIGDNGITCNKPMDAFRRWHWNPHTDLTQQGDHRIRTAWGPLTVLHRTLQDYLLAGRPS